MQKVIKALCAILINTMMGGFVALLIGFKFYYGAIVANAVASLLPILPKEVLRIGVLTEIWTGELVKTLRKGEEATWIDGVPDYSQYAENDVIHLVDVGADPEVLIDNTTYPIDVEDLEDGDIAISLSKFTTKATRIKDDELYALSYDKIGSVKERHGSAINVAKFKKAAHAFAPDTNTAKTPIIKTTGEVVSGRKMLLRADIISLKKAFDDMGAPKEGRRLVLCSDHVNDLLTQDQKFENQYYNYQDGKILKLYGFEIFEFENCPYYKGVGGKVDQKMGLKEKPANTDYQASFAFVTKQMFKSKGSTKMYYSEAAKSPTTQANLINFTHRFIALPKQKQAFGAIISTQG